MSFMNYHKQVKTPYMVYANFECVLKKISSCKPAPNSSFTVKAEKHKPCRFSYMVMRSDGTTFGPFTYKGEDLVFTFLIWLQNHEKEMQEEMANKRLLIMIPEDWKKHRNVLNCHICNKSLVKDLYCDWWYTILIQENTADKVTEDATTMRQKINMCRTIGENQKMK